MILKRLACTGVLLLVGGCAGAAGPKASPAGGSSSGVSTGHADHGSAATSTGDVQPSLTYLFVAQRIDRGRMEALDDAVWDCMESQGFRTFRGLYVRDESLPPGTDIRMGFQPTRPASEAWAKEHGYGVSIVGSAATSVATPLDEYLGQLSTSERNSYHNALFGKGIGDVAFGHSCRNDATVAVYGDAPGVEVNELLAGVEVRVAAAKEVVAARALWSACMTEAGFPFGSHEAAYASATTAFAQLDGPARASQVSPNPSPTLVAVQARERALAAADARCYAEKLADAEAAVRPQIEQAAVDENAWLIEYADRARAAYKATKR